MGDFPLGHEARRIRNRHEARDQILAVIKFNRVAQRQFSTSTVKQVLLMMAGLGKTFADHPRILSFVAGFLPQLAKTCCDRRFVGAPIIAAGNFQFDRVRPVAILLNHHKLLLGCDGDNVHPIDAVNDVEVVLSAGPR
jgi:hypothetical protein